MGQTIDLSMKNISIYELDEYYGGAILDKQATLFANDDGVIVDGFTQTGKLKDILNNDIYGDFFSDMKVVLLENDGNRVYIDYEWNEETRMTYLRNEIEYRGSDCFNFIKNKKQFFERGYKGYMDMLKYISDNANNVIELLDMIDNTPMNYIRAN